MSTLAIFCGNFSEADIFSRVNGQQVFAETLLV